MIFAVPLKFIFQVGGQPAIRNGLEFKDCPECGHTVHILYVSQNVVCINEIVPLCKVDKDPQLKFRSASLKCYDANHDRSS